MPFFIRRRCVTPPCRQTDGNYSIEFPEIDGFHKIDVRNPSVFRAVSKRSLSPFIQKIYIAALAMAAADDIIIAIAMVCLLKRRRTDVKRYKELKIGRSF